ncbi:MAG: aminodeoxychorismate/anthranilate synthase component II [Cytophagales bacterium]|nr:aminodeoxychorismate/anthranilate synthase component II [Cytophagales bacterium]
MKRLLILDNYDSFTYNLVHMVKELGVQPDIQRNDQIDMGHVDRYDKILLSAGPGIPKQAGIMPELLTKYKATKSILGVCLGHQAIAESEGAILYNLPKVYHGIVTRVNLEMEDTLFQDIPEQFNACRYHSWVIKDENLTKDLLVTSRDDSGIIMSIRHKRYDVRGVQFHPESIMTEYGKQLIKNWIEI